MDTDSRDYVLAVEDSDIDFDIFESVFRSRSKLNIVRAVSGEEALELLAATVLRQEQLPLLILMDLNLTGVNGAEVIELIRKDSNLCRIPVVVLSTSKSSKDVDRAYEVGANTFLTKPLNLPDFENTIDLLVGYWFKAAVQPSRLTSVQHQRAKSLPQ